MLIIIILTTSNSLKDFFVSTGRNEISKAYHKNITIGIFVMKMGVKPNYSMRFQMYRNSKINRMCHIEEKLKKIYIF